MVQTVEENKVGLGFDNFTFNTSVHCFIAMTFHFEAADLTFEVQVSWVDLGTDVDWARRTVEQMEKVFLNIFLLDFIFMEIVVRRSRWQNKNIQRVTVAHLPIPQCR